MTTTRKVLGRGLGALIPPIAPPVPTPMAHPMAPVPAPAAPAPPQEPPRPALSLSPETGAKVVRTFLVGIEEIAPQAGQPRRAFDETALAELAASIRENGILQPLLVRTRPRTQSAQTSTDGQPAYELIAGERRWRAAQRAGLTEVPVIVKEATSKETFEWALIENLQRQDLNPMEEAEAYERLITEHGMTQEQVATKVGKDRSTVTNSLRLLRLPPAVRRLVEEGTLSMGQSRALLGLEHAAEMERVARIVASRGLSVRQVEAMVAMERGRASRVVAKPAPSVTLRDLQTKLSSALGTRVKIVDEGGKGRIDVAWSSLDELDRLLERLLGPPV